MNKLSMVRIEDVRSAWPQVREGLQKIASKMKVDWIPEDIYLAIVTGSATLWFSHNAYGDYKGFVVTQKQGERLFVWAANSTTLAAMDGNNELAIMAKAQGYKALRFVSGRKGWWRRAKLYGYKFVEATYEMEL